MVPGFAGVYWIAVGTFDSRWDFIRDNMWFHSPASAVLLAGTVCTLLFRGLGDWICGVDDENRAHEYRTTLENLLGAVQRIIDAKAERFREETKQLKPTSNTFRKITHPRKQIKIILNEAKGFFDAALASTDGSEFKFDITIIRIDPYSGNCEYFETAQSQWTHSDANKLLTADQSLLKRCITSGDDAFYADKREAIAQGLYVASQRDIDHDNQGTVYCVPITVELPKESGTESGTLKEQFVVTFVTYGASICMPNDVDAIASTKFLFSEFVHRIRLELTLFSIREWQQQKDKKGS